MPLDATPTLVKPAHQPSLTLRALVQEDVDSDETPPAQVF